MSAIKGVDCILFSSLSTTATLGTEERGRCKEVTVVESF